ncbi:hypothetical protein BESB_005090 [Besnoitia besnoiti]|uniref:Uncharacterized protein n=1 Tax=Besnoitia besnoiti TaxID=94643 RepID=A0A2A9MHZ5_BESBE|nr:hypothetical protein BESB_005090 [Besnoitia besnoiti]PFH38168.1 hypothetical protein BESB_005090 [Besnoitia besnoiti]
MGCVICRTREAAVVSPGILQGGSKEEVASRNSTTVATRRTDSRLAESIDSEEEGQASGRSLPVWAQQDEEKNTCGAGAGNSISRFPHWLEETHDRRKYREEGTAGAVGGFIEDSVSSTSLISRMTFSALQKEMKRVCPAIIPVADDTEMEFEDDDPFLRIERSAFGSSNPQAVQASDRNSHQRPLDSSETLDSRQLVAFREDDAAKMTVSTISCTKRLRGISSPINMEAWANLAFDPRLRNDVNCSEEILGCNYTKEYLYMVVDKGSRGRKTVDMAGPRWGFKTMCIRT